MTTEQIAQVCHEANAAYCRTQGDYTQLPWNVAPQWQRESAVKGVQFHHDNPAAGAADSHEAWMREKLDTGWKYGPVKDPEKKEHPQIVPYHELPIEQRRKDYLFAAVVRALSESGE